MKLITFVICGMSVYGSSIAPGTPGETMYGKTKNEWYVRDSYCVSLMSIDQFKRKNKWTVDVHI